MHYYKISSKFVEVAARKMCSECEGFVKKGSKILDFGCGSGIVAKAFKDRFEADIFGIDIKDMRLINIPFKIYDGKGIPFPDNYFDVVLSAYVLHHISDQNSALKEIKRVVKDKIIIFEDVPNGVIPRFISKLHGISFAKFFQNNTEKGKFLNDQGWKKAFKDLGLKLIFEKKASSFFDPVKKKVFILEKTGA